MSPSEEFLTSHHVDVIYFLLHLLLNISSSDAIVNGYFLLCSEPALKGISWDKWPPGHHQKSSSASCIQGSRKKTQHFQRASQGGTEEEEKTIILLLGKSGVLVPFCTEHWCRVVTESSDAPNPQCGRRENRGAAKEKNQLRPSRVWAQIRIWVSRLPVSERLRSRPLTVQLHPELPRDLLGTAGMVLLAMSAVSFSCTDTMPPMGLTDAYVLLSRTWAILTDNLPIIAEFPFLF